MQGAKNIGDWDPALYENFKKERREPFVDLLGLVKVRPNLRIVDLGCGTGKNALEVANLFPNSQVLGVDNSESMLKECTELTKTNSRLKFQFLHLDQVDSLEGNYDVIFANSALHWISDHESLFPKIVSKLVPDTGQLAVQFPTNHTQEFYVMMQQVADLPEFKTELKGWKLRWPLLEIDHYATLLYNLGCTNIQVFEKVYPHLLPSANSIVAWVRGTGMRTYLSRLETDKSRDNFIAKYSETVNAKYPTGKVFFPFRRILVSAQRGK